VTARVLLAAAHGKAHASLRAAARRLHAQARTTISLRLSPKQVAALRRALGKKGHALRAGIAVHAQSLIPPGGLPVAPTEYRATVQARA
jgi:hypothetical protein